VAVVTLDLPTPQLDRTFDYLVPMAMDTVARPGARVAVRFGGRRVNGFIVERRPDSAHPGKLSPLLRVASGLPLLTPGLWRLAKAIAERQAGTVADVLRLAIPAAHVTTEKRLAGTASSPLPPSKSQAAASGPELSRHEPANPEHPLTEFIAGLARGERGRVVWSCLPGADLAAGLAGALAANRLSGGQALIVAPSEHRVSELARLLGEEFTVARLVAGDGPEARLEGYWAAASGMAEVLVGTRAAAFAPLARPGLLVLLNDGDPLLRELHAPYAHARTVMTVRAGQEGAGLLLAGLGRSVEAQALAESGWLRSVNAGRGEVRAATPVVRAPTAQDLAREGSSAASRLPEAAFRLIRQAVTAGPVLIQVPSANHEAYGLARTAGELVRAFPSLPLERSSAEAGRLVLVGPEVRLVVATPGCEPTAKGSYAAAVLLDAGTWAGRAELDAAVDALRIWMGAAALVRSRGPVLLLGSEGAAAAQALVRWDPVGLAARELAGRRELGLPPVTKAVVLTGTDEAIGDLVARLDLDPSVRVRPGEDRTVLLIPLPAARETIARIQSAVRSGATARPSAKVRVKVDGELG
jgi:primosomal protein N' (replication factor Y)